MGARFGFVIGVLAAALVAQAARAELVYVGTDFGLTVIDAGTRSVVRDDEALKPRSLAISPDGSVLYVAVGDQTAEVQAIDSVNWQVLRQYPLASAPFDMALSGDGRRLWVRQTSGYAVLDTSDYAGSESRAAHSSGYIAADETGDVAYVANLGLGGSLVAIDASTLQVVASAGLLYQASGVLALHPDNATVYNLGWEFGPFIQINDPFRDRFGNSFRPPASIGSNARFHDIAFTAGGDRAYVTQGLSDNLLVLDTSAPLEPKLLRTIDFDLEPNLVIASAVAGRAYVIGSRWSRTVIRSIDVETGQQIPLAHLPSVTIIGSPLSVVVGFGGAPEVTATATTSPTPTPTVMIAPGTTDRIYVATSEGVTTIDPVRGEILRDVPLGAAAALSGDGEALFVGSTDSDGVDRLSVLDASGKILKSIVAPGQVAAIERGPDGRLWVTHASRCPSESPCARESRITIFDASLAVVAEVMRTGLRPSSRIAIGVGGEVAFVTNSFSGIAAIDTQTFESLGWSYSICCLGSVVEVHPNGTSVYALGNEFGGFVAVADWTGNGSYAPVEFLRDDHHIIDFQTDIAFSADGKRAYLPGTADGPKLFVMDTTEPLRPTTERIVDLHHVPAQIAISANSHFAYLTNRSDRSLTVFDLDTYREVETIALGTFPNAVLAQEVAADASPQRQTESGCQLTAAAKPSWILTLLTLLPYFARLARSIANRDGQAICPHAACPVPPPHNPEPPDPHPVPRRSCVADCRGRRGGDVYDLLTSRPKGTPLVLVRVRVRVLEYGTAFTTTIPNQQLTT